MRYPHYTLIIICLNIPSVFCQGQSELAKSNINKYLFTNLHDFNSYEPIVFSELRILYSSLDNNNTYKKLLNRKDSCDFKINEYSSGTEINSIRIKELESSINELKSQIELWKGKNYSSIDSVPKNEISDIYRNNPYLKELFERREAIKDNKIIPGMEYLSRTPRDANDEMRINQNKNNELSRIEREINNQNKFVTLKLKELAEDRNKQILEKENRISFLNSELIKENQQNEFYKENLPKAKATIADIKAKIENEKLYFKSNITGYYMCHQFRSKNTLGAFVNSIYCFEFDQKFNIINVSFLD